MSELEKMPPAAGMRYDDEDPDAVASVLVRVEYADGRIREYEAREPQAFEMNNPADPAEMSLRPMKMAVQAAGSPVVPMMAAVPALRLSFTANPRHNMRIRTERTAEPARPEGDVSPRATGEVLPTPPMPDEMRPVLLGSLCRDPSEDHPEPSA